MHLLMLLFIFLYFSDPSGSNLFFLISLLLSHKSRISAVIQDFFLLTMCAKDLTGCFSHSKRAFQLVKDLTTVKQGKATTVQDRSGKCLTEEWQILNRWTEFCSQLYNYKADGDPSVLNCTQTDTEDDHPIQRSGGCCTIIEEREVSWSRRRLRRIERVFCTTCTIIIFALTYRVQWV